MSVKQKGFSLVTAMIGLAAVGGIGLMIMQQQEASTKLQAKNHADQIIDSAANIVQISLASRAICTHSLKNKGVGDTVTTLFDAQVDPANINNTVPAGPNLVDVGQILPHGVNVQEMKIVNDKGVDYLLVTFNRDALNRKKLGVSDFSSKRFILRGVKDSVTQKYISCYSEVTNSIADAHAQACTDAGGTRYGDECLHVTAPIYFDSTKGALVATAGSVSRYSCTSCGSNRCNPCPAGRINVGGGSVLVGASCGGTPTKYNHTWSFNCSTGAPAPYGKVFNNIP